MLKNYLKTAWRSFYKNKFFSVINIGGLAVGMAVAMLIGLWIWDELSYDKYNKNYDRIAEVMQQSTVNGEVSTNYPCPAPLADELRNTYGSGFKHVPGKAETINIFAKTPKLGYLGSTIFTIMWPLSSLNWVDGLGKNIPGDKDSLYFKEETGQSTYDEY